jgi:hypothetical protein
MLYKMKQNIISTLKNKDDGKTKKLFVFRGLQK